MKSRVPTQNTDEIIKYLKSHLCDQIFSELGPDQNDIINLESQFIEKKLQQFRGNQRKQLSTFIKKYIALTNCYTISRSRFKQLLFFNGESNSYNHGFDILIFENNSAIFTYQSNTQTNNSPKLKDIISKIPIKASFVDKEIVEKLQEYQKSYSKTNLMAYNENYKVNTNQQQISRSKSRNNSSHANSSTQISRNSSFVDYRNSNYFVKDFKSYLNNKSHRNSSYMEVSPSALPKTQQQQRPSSSQNNRSKQEEQRKEQPKNLERNQSNIGISQNQQPQYKFSLLGGDDINQKKSAYIKLHGKANEDKQNSSTTSPMLTMLNNPEQKLLMETKTPQLNPALLSLQKESPGEKQQLHNESNFLLNSSINLQDESNYQTSIFFSPQKDENGQPIQNESQQSPNKNKLASTKNPLQQKSQNYKYQQQLQKDESLSKLAQPQQKEILDHVQLGYNNYMKYKGGNKLNKIMMQNSPSPDKEQTHNQSRKTNNNNSMLTKEPDWSSIMKSEPSLMSCIQPDGYYNKAFNKMKDSRIRNSSRHALQTESSPKKSINQSSLERRENLQSYFKEIFLSHSRRENVRVSDLEASYNLKKSFIDHCAKQGVPLQKILESRANYVRQDQELILTDKPSDETPLQLYNQTQLTKSLSPQRKKDLEHVLFQLEKGEEIKDPSKTTKNNVYRSFFNKPISKTPQTVTSITFKPKKNNENVDILPKKNNQDRDSQIERLKMLVEKTNTSKQDSPELTCSPKYFIKSMNAITSPLLKPRQNSIRSNASFQKISLKKLTPRNVAPTKQKLTEQQLIDMIFEKDELENEHKPKRKEQQKSDDEDDEEQGKGKNPIFSHPSSFYLQFLETLE